MLILIFVVAFLMMVIEYYYPGQQQEQTKYWWLRAILFNSIQLAFVFIAGMSWDSWMQNASLWHSNNSLTTPWQIIIGYFTVTFIYYWWHRARHQIDFLWRWLHQFHHSPRRIEIITSFYKNPLEIMINSILSSAILYIILGVSPEAGSITIGITGLAELIYHWNVKTPYWMGFIFQRPESHRIHHQENAHKNNYSDLPLWDMLFGTFENPNSSSIQCGFTDNKELKLRDMLSGIDVHKKREMS